MLTLRELKKRDDRGCANVDPELFFPGPGNTENSASTKKAKRLCDACPYCADCLDIALDAAEPYGIWGGVTQAERLKLLGRNRIRVDYVARLAAVLAERSPR